MKDSARRLNMCVLIHEDGFVEISRDGQHFERADNFMFVATRETDLYVDLWGRLRISV